MYIIDYANGKSQPINSRSIVLIMPLVQETKISPLINILIYIGRTY